MVRPSGRPESPLAGEIQQGRPVVTHPGNQPHEGGQERPPQVACRLPLDDIPFPLYGSILQFRVLQNIGNDIERGRYVLAEAFGKVHCLLMRRVRVEMNTKVLDL
jgi:hypothetical protein